MSSVGGSTVENNEQKVPSMDEIASTLEDAIATFRQEAASRYLGEVESAEDGRYIELWRLTRNVGTEVVETRYYPTVLFTANPEGTKIHCLVAGGGALFPFGVKTEENPNADRQFKAKSLPDRVGAVEDFPDLRPKEGGNISQGEGLEATKGGYGILHKIEVHPAALAHGFFNLADIQKGLQR
jgi:hypothetical protein